MDMSMKLVALVAFVAGPDASYITVGKPDRRWRTECVCQSEAVCRKPKILEGYGKI